MTFVQINERGRALLGERLVDDEYTEEPYHRSKHRGVTLGAYRRSKYLPSVPGVIIPVWTPCAAAAHITGSPWPHAYFISVVGSNGDGGSIHCPSCRERLAAACVAPRGATQAPAIAPDDSPF